MKYIIGFVLLGLVTYMGLFFLISGVNEMIHTDLTPVNFNIFTSPSSFTTGAVEGTITQTVGKLNKEGIVTKREFLGIKFGEDIVEYLYVIPAGRVVDNLSKQQYMAVRVLGEDKTAILDNITFTFPKQPSELSGRPGLEFTGYIAEMNDEVFSAVQSFLVSHDKLVGSDEIGEGLQEIQYFNNHICKYTLIIRSDENDHELLIILGSVIGAVGIGGIVLLIVKKVRESSGY